MLLSIPYKFAEEVGKEGRADVGRNCTRLKNVSTSRNFQCSKEAVGESEEEYFNII